ncbi:MAG: hypothetical protein KC478_00965 [Bacteriovoracaceae bacterium]|nr:hypothetical protein [Bacteriovoracaceae bacterium]
MSIQEEIHKAMQELQTRNSKEIHITQDDFSLLFLTSLLEEEAPNVRK